MESVINQQQLTPPQEYETQTVKEIMTMSGEWSNLGSMNSSMIEQKDEIEDSRPVIPEDLLASEIFPPPFVSPIVLIEPAEDKPVKEVETKPKEVQNEQPEKHVSFDLPANSEIHSEQPEIKDETTRILVNHDSDPIPSIEASNQSLSLEYLEKRAALIRMIADSVKCLDEQGYRLDDRLIEGILRKK